MQIIVYFVDDFSVSCDFWDIFIVDWYIV
jgi:hypothetical protein